MIDNPVIDDKRPKNMLTADQAAKKAISLSILLAHGGLNTNLTIG